jgi:Zn-dependent peptidase ImmA (M78 family)
MDWREEQHYQEKAGKTADDLIARLRLTPPIDPLEITKSERRFLRSAGCDLGKRYDGKLEFVKTHGLFLLYYNTKYDAGLPEGEHHPRTRFSISHELGHYFIDEHHQKPAARGEATPIAERVSQALADGEGGGCICGQFVDADEVRTALRE